VALRAPMASAESSAPRRRTTRLLPLLGLIPMVTASLGSATHPPPPKPYRATAAIAPGGTSQTQRVEAATLLQDLAGLPLALDEARRGYPGTRSKVDLTISPSGLFRIATRAESAPVAVAFANRIASELAQLGVQVSSQATGTPGLVLGDFEGGSAGTWGLRTSAFSLPPKQITIARGARRFGRASLLVRCSPSPGCGTAMKPLYPFLGRTPYTVSAWVRAGPDSQKGIRVRLVVGRRGDDVVTSKTRTANDHWQQITTTWTPLNDSATTEIGLQTPDAGGSFYVDGVTLADPSVASPQPVLGRLTAAQVATLSAASAGAAPIPAQSATKIRSSTLTWGLIGLGVGLLLALAGLIGAHAARRRAPEGEQNPFARKDPVAGGENVDQDREHGAKDGGTNEGRMQDDGTPCDPEEASEQEQAGDERDGAPIKQGGRPEALRRDQHARVDDA